jgi:hypothetical protein
LRHHPPLSFYVNALQSHCPHPRHFNRVHSTFRSATGLPLSGNDFDSSFIVDGKRYDFILYLYPLSTKIAVANPPAVMSASAPAPTRNKPSDSRLTGGTMRGYRRPSHLQANKVPWSPCANFRIQPHLLTNCPKHWSNLRSLSTDRMKVLIGSSSSPKGNTTRLLHVGSRSQKEEVEV